jgi:hypothetical protein
MWLHASDVYDWWSPTVTNEAGSGSSHRCQIMSGSSTTLMNSDKGLHRDTWATGMDGWRSMDSVRKWRYRGRDHFWMFSCLSLLFSSVDLGLAQMASAWDFSTFWVSQVEVEFPHAPDVLKGHHWAVPISCGTYGFVRLHTSDDCFIPHFPLLLFSYTGIGSPGGLRWKRGIM